MKIENLDSCIILNSQGRKAVQCTLTLKNGRAGTFAPPAGTSIGKYEAKTVSAEAALEQISDLSSELQKSNYSSQRELDDYLKKQEIGANASLAISIAYAIAANTLRKTSDVSALGTSDVYTPKLMVLFFEGGVHSSSRVKVQEYMAIYDDIFTAADGYHKLKQKLINDGYVVNVGMEGGMVSEQLNDEAVMKLMAGKKIALDIGGGYLEDYKTSDVSVDGTSDVVSVEDPFPEDAVEEWREFYRKYNDKFLIVGDDLTVTDADRIERYANNAINAVIIKPNQQRTLTDTLNAISTAKENKLKTVISHRSGETNQTFVTDLSIAAHADYVKFGAPIRGERVAKYNRLLEFQKFDT